MYKKKMTWIPSKFVIRKKGFSFEKKDINSKRYPWDGIKKRNYRKYSFYVDFNK